MTSQIDATSQVKLGMGLVEGSKVAPGDRIGSARRLHPGAGCYIRGNHIFASAVGTLNICNENDMSVVSVILEKGRIYASSQVLSIGMKVIGKVGRIMNQQATVEIVAAEDIGALREHHGGTIRKEDVRIGVSEDVKIHESFRPGDVVLARIISLGDSRRYFLTTAENELGVIRAVSSHSGKVMVPISYKEMECPETKIAELRKCAKPKELQDA
mmetsp:Transcript_18257/g.22349  ORF Transcript_18257/g.22349 Transcript_18257/m.22349 type:complete len:214 (+) Transcript_18257:121-762(+)